MNCLSKIFLVSILGAIGLFFTSFTDTNPLTLDELFNRVELEMGSVSTLQFNLKRTERFGDEMVVADNFIRYQSNPFKSMIQFLGDKEGNFLIYSPNENDGKARYIPHGFPYMNLSLEPESDLMRKTSHYTVREMGVKFIVDQIKGNYLKWQPNFFLRGKVTLNNQTYFKIEGVLEDVPLISYTIKENETLASVAKKHFVAEYMLMEMNDNIDDLQDNVSGLTIKIPTCYANHIVMLVNTQTFFPEKIVIKDTKGLFEQYEYSKITINKPIDPKWFSESYLDGLY